MPKDDSNPVGAAEVTTLIAPLDLEPMIAANQRGLKAAAEAQAHLFARLNRMNAELFAFIDRRLQRDRETARAFAGCATPQEAAMVCARAAEAAVKDYTQEAGLLAGFCADHAREAVDDAQRQVETTIETAVSG